MTSAIYRIAAAALAALGFMLPAAVGFAQGSPKIQANRDEIVGKLANHQFHQLDRELSAYEEQAENDLSFEMNAMVAFSAFDTSQELIAARLNDWVKTMPDSYAAALARAHCEVETAFRWRYYDNRPQRLAKMAQALRDARGDLTTALAIHPNLGLAYALRIKAARFGAPKAELEHDKSDALAEAPASFAVREQIMFSLRPLWGGSQEAMREFAVASQDYAARNRAMRFLLGWVALDSGDALAGQQGKEQQAIDDYTRALQAGGDYWMAYLRRAEAFYDLGQMKDSLRDATRAQELFPGYYETLRLLAYTTAFVNQPDKSIVWVSEFMRFEPTSSNMEQLFMLDEVALESHAAKQGIALAHDASSPQQEKLQDMESTLPSEPGGRFYRLSDVANAAFDARDFDKAEQYANELLSDARQYPNDWNYGNAIFQGNIVLGRVALARDKNIEQADSYLLAAGASPGSPQLNSFGPTMSLAKELLEAGERTVVLDFLDQCRRFWKMGRQKLNVWIDTIKAGGTPDFGVNLTV